MRIAERKKRPEDRNQKSGRESDAWPRRGWSRWGIQDLHYLLQNLHDGRLVHVQSGGELFFERSEFLRKLTRTEQRFAHLDEGADDEHAHLNGARAAKHICSLKCAVLSKGIRKRPTPAATAF